MIIPHGSHRRVEESTTEDDDLVSPKREIIHIAHLETMHHHFLRNARARFKERTTVWFYRWGVIKLSCLWHSRIYLYTRTRVWTFAHNCTIVNATARIATEKCNARSINSHFRPPHEKNVHLSPAGSPSESSLSGNSSNSVIEYRSKSTSKPHR